VVGVTKELTHSWTITTLLTPSESSLSAICSSFKDSERHVTAHHRTLVSVIAPCNNIQWGKVVEYDPLMRKLVQFHMFV
jgi:hypothetical protein